MNQDREHIERMRREGRLSDREAQRLLASVQAQGEREESFRTRSASAMAAERRRVRFWLGILAGVFLLGLVGGLGLGPSAPPPVLRGTQPAPVSGRLVDLSTLADERRTSMNRSGTFSAVVFALIVLAVVGGLLMWLYNRLVVAREGVNAGWAQVENVYQRRLDLVPVLVDAVQSYMQHERETLTELTEARSRAMQASGMLGSRAPETAEQVRTLRAAQGEVESALTRLFAVVENYPELKASRNFVTLQDQLEGTENRIAIERRNYNEAARRYNTMVQTIPSNLVAGLFAFHPKPYFEAESAALSRPADPFGRHPG